jgi:hypothetical protein
MVTPERTVIVVKMFAPLVLGAVLIILGLLQSSWGLFGAGAGLLGVPGVSEALRTREGGDDAGPAAAAP